MDYRVVYDASQHGYDPTPVSFGVTFCILGALLWFGGWRGVPRDAKRRGPGRLFAGFFFGFSLLWTVLVVGGTLIDHVTTRSALAEGRTRLVEGPIEHFAPARADGKGAESFDVAGVHFVYKDFRLGPGFSHVSTRGGPLHQGLNVRIHYLGAEMLRIEVADGETSVATAPPRDEPPMWLFPPLLILAMLLFPRGLAYLSGWRALADRFGTPALPVGEAFTWQSLSLGLLGGYNGCINVSVAPDAIGFVPTLPFGFGHAPLTIPMRAIRAVTRERAFLRTSTVITLQADGEQIVLRGPAGEAVHRAWMARDPRTWSQPVAHRSK
jgi:hypothetical protein